MPFNFLREGFARLSTEKFTLDPSKLGKLFIHLTNYAIQKENMDYKNCNSDAIIGSTKISLKTLKERLEENGHNFDKIWTQTCEIVVKSLIACEQDIPNNPNCFEFFGYDIIIDDNLNCQLLEVNSSPSLHTDTVLDEIIKQQLIDDILDIVCPLDFDKKNLIEVLQRRIKVYNHYSYFFFFFLTIIFSINFRI